MAIGTALAIAAGASALGGYASSKAQKKAAKRAAATSQQVTNQNNALAREIYDKNNANLQPFMGRGNQAGAARNALLGLGDSALPGSETLSNQRAAFDNFRNSTGYEFRIGEGMKALDTGFSMAGARRSGARDKAAMRYGQNFGSNEFGNYMGYLGQQENLGFNAANSLANGGTNFANQVMANNSQNGTNQANAAFARANATNTFWSGLGGGAGLLLGSSFGGR
jgi:hypothetical protein